MNGQSANKDAFDAKRLLGIFTLVNALTYFDRGSVATALETIEKKVYNLNNLEGGLLGGAYMFGYVTASPIFAQAVRTREPFRVMAIGLFIWCLATLFTGLSLDFWTLMLARAATGVGEASFLCIAPPFIDKAAPEHLKSRWLATFFCAIPVGYAFGFLLSGSWIDASVFSDAWQWRVIFIAESIVMFPFVIYCALRAPCPFSFATHSAADKDLRGSLKQLLHNKPYMAIVLGYAAQTFVIGSFAYFGVQYLEEVLGFSPGTSGRSFGGLTVVTGIVGTGMGGYLVDKLSSDGAQRSDLTVIFKLITVLSILAIPFCLATFMIQNSITFFIFLGVGELMMFACLSPINSAILWAVPFELTPLACALSVVFIHVLGDAISPIIVGELLDASNNNWRLTMVLDVAWLGWAVLCWSYGWSISRKLAADASLAPLLDALDATEQAVLPSSLSMQEASITRVS